MRIVLKYGGTSVETIEKIKEIADYILDLKNSNYKEIVIVASAMGKMTDELIKRAKAVCRIPDQRELDVLMSIGEQQTVALLAMALKDKGMDVISLTGLQANIFTTGIHTKSKIKDIDISPIENHLKSGKIVIVTGFQGVNESGDITTLGRGGSDTSAVALAAALRCECRIYTDVDGIYTVDPRVYKRAKLLNRISYEMMMEMAHLGAGVMETRAVELGKKFKVPIFVGRSLTEKGGTYIMEREKISEEKLVTGISVMDKIVATNLSGIKYSAENFAKIFQIFNETGINLNMINQNIETDGTLRLSFNSIDSERNLLDKALENIKLNFKTSEFKQKEEFGMVSLVGIGMVNNSNVTGRLFSALSEAGIDVHGISTSEISISCSLDRSNVNSAVEFIAREFNL